MKYLVGSAVLLYSLSSFAMDKYCNGAPTVIHANGGGHVAITATVAPTVLVETDAAVCEYAVVEGMAEVRDEGRVYGLARIGDGATIAENAEVFGNAILNTPEFSNSIVVQGQSKIFGNVKLHDEVIVTDTARVFDNAVIRSKALIEGTALVYGNATVTGNANIKGTAKIHGQAYIGGDVQAIDGANICDNRYFEGKQILSTTICAAPQPIRLVSTQVATRGNHTCSLFAHGKVRCWGYASDGMLGYGNTNTIGDNELPNTQPFVSTGGLVTKIATGQNHTCVLLETKNVRCWGIVAWGRLGVPNLSTNLIVGDNELPTAISEVNLNGPVSDIAVGSAHTCVIINGSVRCWGYNNFGQLGLGNTSNVGVNDHPSNYSFVNLGGGFVTQLALGDSHTCALMSGGTVRCWGANGQGQLGYGNTNTIGDNELPNVAGTVNVGGVVTQIVAGGSFTCALLNTGNVKCWGAAGGFGYGSTTNIGDDELPSSIGEINLGAPVGRLAAGRSHVCALGSGAVRCWGSGGYGQLGYGNTETIGDNELPSSVGNVNVGFTVAGISAGGEVTCAISDKGRVRCWGYGGSGVLGYGNTWNVGDLNTPASVGEIFNFTSKTL